MRAPKRLPEREDEIQEILVSLKSKGEGASRREDWSIVTITTQRENKTKATWRCLLISHSPSHFFKPFESQTPQVKKQMASLIIQLVHMWNLCGVHNYLLLLDMQEKFRRNTNKIQLPIYLATLQTISKQCRQTG